MKLATLCSGIDAFALGAQRNGIEIVYQCEIDKDCRDILSRHWPNVKRGTDVNDQEVADDLIRLRPDIVAFGSPCQDLSVAGDRGGLSAERSGLFYRCVELCFECQAPWVVWENVPGVFSSHDGNDFASVIEAFTGFRPEVPREGWTNTGVCVGPLYSVAWSVLDSRWCGVPQRRRRVFLVGHLSDRSGAYEVLSLASRVPWNIAPSTKARSIVAALTANGVGTCGADDGQAQAGHLIPDVANSISTDDRKYDAGVDTYIPEVAATLTGEGHDRTEDGSGKVTLIPVPIQEVDRRMSQHGSGVGDPGDPMFTLQAKTEHAVAIAFQERGRPEGRTVETQDDVAYSLMSKDGGGRSQENCIAYQCHGNNVGPMGTLRAGNGNEAGGVPFVFEPRIGRCDRGEPSDVVNTLKGSDAGDTSDMRPVAVYRQETEYAVRRLLPVECERLQAFPDDFTRYRADGTELKDGPRYRMLGNAVTVSVADWIFTRIKRFDRGTE